MDKTIGLDLIECGCFLLLAAQPCSLLAPLRIDPRTGKANKPRRARPL
jgi:hypothetical protein